MRFEHEAAPVGLSNRNGKFCTMEHEQRCETWLPARQAGLRFNPESSVLL